jgi:hypothetical protein
MNDPSGQRARLRVADEAARLMLEEGIRDYHHAKRKAAGQLGLGDRASLPTNLEVRDAIHRYREIFFTDEDFAHEALLWRTALAAMRLLADFEPRLTGPVLEGTAGRHSPVILHVFSDTTEAVLWHLMEHGIRYQELERRLRVQGEIRAVPGVRFFGGDVEVEVIVFPGLGVREAPASQTDGRPMRRAGLAEVRERVQALEAGAPLSRSDDRAG